VRRLYDLATARNRQTEGETVEQKRARVAVADNQYAEAAGRLSRMVLEPVRKQLGTKRLLVVTQGALQFIPFGILPAPAAATENQGQRPLMTDHEIVSVSSASTLALLRSDSARRKPAPKALAVLADPVYSNDDARLKERTGKRSPGSQQTGSARLEAASEVTRAVEDLKDGGILSQGLPRLFVSRWEANEITSLVPAGESMQALDFAANRATATSPELAQYRIIHFATHAFIDNVHPELSGMVLSLVNERGQPQDGFLRVHEIFNLKLPAELIVLSACRTGLGKNVEGEGMLGMTRGFMYAGAPRVIVSLWAVNDKATSELMVRFYKKLLGPERMSPAAALRAAQIEMSGDKRWQSPYFWGAFVLQGDWR
jgi:CHAT domain-containing protein